MDWFGLGFVLAIIFALVGIALTWVKAFQKSIGWGFAVLFVPVMLLVFVGLNWSKTWKPFVLYLVCSGIAGNLFFHSPVLIAVGTRAVPECAALAKQIDPAAYAEAQKIGLPSNMDKGPAPSPTPHEVRDLAESETPLPAAVTPPPDTHAAQRAAYAKHAKDLTAAYQQLNTERAKLKPGSPAVAAFNAKAAKYQQDVAALADEKAKLDALDHAANLNADAAAALASLQASAASGDYEAFAATLKKALDNYRQTPAFPGIVALARTTLAQVTGDKVAAGLHERATKSAHAEFDKTTRQVQGIVNQTPPMVGHPPPGAEVYHYAFHPGANPPDYRADNLVATRELWKGQYVYMDDAPGVFYRSADCEFNPQTKYFYTSRSVPKKRLSNAEYQELTRLYRLLSQQEKALADAAPPAGQAERITADLAALKAQLDGYAMK